MGASISVAMANLTMEVIEQKALQSFASRPQIFLRYIDDCFCIIQGSEVDNFLGHLNSIEPAIQFTVEREHNNTLPFLDVLVRRQGDALKFTVHRKPTHSGRYLRFDSNHPVSHKASVVSTLFTRAKAVCSSENDKRKEEQTIISDLKKNGYTGNFIRHVVRRQNHNRINQPARTASKPLARVSIPYVKGTSELLSRLFAKEHIMVAHKPVSTLGHFLPRPKDKPPKDRAQGVIYKIPCSQCPASYIGESKNFHDRLRQHKNDVRNFDRERSALAEHCETLDHRIAFENASILDTASNLRRRHLVESWYIQTTSNNINRSLGALPTLYITGLQDIITDCARHDQPTKTNEKEKEVAQHLEEEEAAVLHSSP